MVKISDSGKINQKDFDNLVNHKTPSNFNVHIIQTKGSAIHWIKDMEYIYKEIAKGCMIPAECLNPEEK